ncbi:M28 family metallopeptidase [Vitreimonas flagellata]|uniref:M28 family metallopeptidase n=1 Tax=Vitreimonas flagellata TaxID=2560861 RepID=UPI001074CAC7|nr:M28 family metallopeptidase [Vitreimonas flagellata]
MRLRHVALAAVFALAACASASQTTETLPPPPNATAFAAPPLSAAALLEHTRTLASDEFEGRAPGTNGERLTVDYVSRSFAAAGLEPGVTLPDGTRSWVQETQLSAATLTNTPTLTLRGRDGARDYAYATQFSAWTRRLEPTINIESAELVFVGYGVNAPELGWNDYEGVDVRGKIVVILINDPDFETGDDRGFGGRAMTYYGRWTYKFEEAGRQGAAGALIVHETAPASYPWAVIQSSTGSARWDVVRANGGADRAGFEGWMNNEVAMETFRRAGLDFNQLKARAQQRGFRAVPMNLSGSVRLETTVETRTTSNIVGVLPGRTRPDETILYSAHWDHLGRCPAIDGDDICNGALDNATGTSALIELARRYHTQGAPERSVAFIALTAEEQGLLGALYYMQNPIFPARNTVAAINMDGINNAGLTRDIEVVGFGKSEMDDLIVEAARAQGRRVEPDSAPEAGYFYRSDHLHFAQLGIPVLYTSNGIDMVDGGVARGRAINEAYTANNYHKPSDEVTADWDMSGGAQDLELLYAVGRRLADGNEWPQWRENAEFRAARTASGR